MPVGTWGSYVVAVVDIVSVWYKTDKSLIEPSVWPLVAASYGMYMYRYVSCEIITHISNCLEDYVCPKQPP